MTSSSAGTGFQPILLSQTRHIVIDVLLPEKGQDPHLVVMPLTSGVLVKGLCPLDDTFPMCRFAGTPDFPISRNWAHIFLEILEETLNPVCRGKEHPDHPNDEKMTSILQDSHSKFLKVWALWWLYALPTQDLSSMGSTGHQPP